VTLIKLFWRNDEIHLKKINSMETQICEGKLEKWNNIIFSKMESSNLIINYSTKQVLKAALVLGYIKKKELREIAQILKLKLN